MDALRSAVLAAQPVLEPSVHDALEPMNEDPEDLDPSMSQSIDAVLCGANIAANDVDTELAAAAAGSAESEAVRARVKDLWEHLKEN